MSWGTETTREGRMPFDGSDFHGQGPRKQPPGERVASIVFLVLALTMLIAPISMNALVDIVQYFGG